MIEKLKYPGRILIAEDEDSLREALVIFLKARGYVTAEAADGISAFEMAGLSSYDLLITDLNMPGMSGEELFEKMEELEFDRRPAVVVMTGHSTLDSAIKGINAGISAYIRKPLNLIEMETSIKTAIERRRLEKELKGYYRELDRKVEERTRELSLINKFSALINSSFSLEKILEDAVEDLVQSMEADAAWIYLSEGKPPLFKMKASRGLPKSFIEAASSIDPKAFAAVSGRMGGPASFLCNGPLPSSVPISDAVQSAGFTSAVHASIQSGRLRIGSMGVASKTGKQFQESHIQLITSFGNHIGIAIEKIRLYQKEKAISKDLEKKVNQLLVLNWMGNRARVSKGLEETGKMLVSSIAEALGFDKVCLWVFDKDGRTLYLKACHGLDAGAYRDTCVVDGSGITSFSLDRGEAVLVSSSLCSFSEAKDFLGSSGEAVVAPLVVHNEKGGELNCWEYFGCGKRSCSAYMNSGLACWTLTDSCMKTSDRMNLLDKMEVCKKCDVYKTNTSGKGIGLICADNSISGKVISSDDVKVLNVFANSAAAIIENMMLMERLLEDEKFIDGMITNMSSGLLVTDLDGRVRILNNAGAEILRTDRTLLEGQLLADVYPEAAVMLDIVGSQLGRELDIKTPGGIVPVGFTNSYLVEKDGMDGGVIVVFKDLSEIRKLHEQLREKEHFSAIGKVAAGVAHEIRNPLFGITSVAQILGREIKEDTPQKALIDAMLSETSRLNTLVEDMLLYGRSTKLAPQPVDLNRLIEGVLLFHQGDIKEKGLKVATEFDKSLSQLLLDQGQIKQVFLNLLVNAVDASGAGDEIRVRTGIKGEFAVIEIIDNGVGIPVDDLPKVFDLFYTTKEKGTGLGLAICRKIVEDHGGTVTILSLPGKGTSIRIKLPVQGAGVNG
jgi:signal transduction histidine kinase/DNA-binding response OmpR family regulator